jgi:hypothetical protein
MFCNLSSGLNMFKVKNTLKQSYKGAIFLFSLSIFKVQGLIGVLERCWGAHPPITSLKGDVFRGVVHLLPKN